MILFLSTQLVDAQIKNIIKVADAVLDSYIGRYAPAPDFILEFTKEKDHLILTIRGQAPIPFFPESQSKFFIKEDPAITVEFIKAKDGTINKVIMTQGRIMTANRIGIENYNPNKQYDVEQLKTDFNFLRSTLERVHPRLYDFTPKGQLDRSMDSLYSAIDAPMNEIQFRYFLMPLIAAIHDGHLSLTQSVDFSQYRPTLLPPFILYYEGEKAYILDSSDSLLKPGTEVLSINGISSKSRINNTLARVSGDGVHLNVQYYLANRAMNWFSNELPYWFNVSSYNLSLLEANNKEVDVQVEAIDMDEFVKQMPPSASVKDQINIPGKGQPAVLSYPRLDFPNDSLRNAFLSKTFSDLKKQKVNKLIVDLRGNGGGSPDDTAYLLKYLLSKDFIYSQTTAIPEYTYLTQETRVDQDRFRGKMYFLIDGGSFSSTGHLLSLIQYYRAGQIIGETSSGSYSCNTNGFPYVFPNTRLVLNCPDGIYETAVRGHNRAAGIVPDYEIKKSFFDVLNKVDPQMEFAKKLAAN